MHFFIHFNYTTFKLKIHRIKNCDDSKLCNIVCVEYSKIWYDTKNYDLISELHSITSICQLPLSKTHIELLFLKCHAFFIVPQYNEKSSMHRIFESNNNNREKNYSNNIHHYEYHILLH